MLAVPLHSVTNRARCSPAQVTQPVMPAGLMCPEFDAAHTDSHRAGAELLTVRRKFFGNQPED